MLFCYCLTTYLFVYFLNKHVRANFVKVTLKLSTAAPGKWKAIEKKTFLGPKSADQGVPQGQNTTRIIKFTNCQI